MFARTFILIAAAIIGVNAACDSGLPGYTHIVNPGETCWGIATQGGIDVARLESANPSINCDLLVVGQAKALRSQQLMFDLSKGRKTRAPVEQYSPLEYDKPLLLETVLTGPRRLAELEFLEQSLPDCDVVREDCDQLDGNITIAQAALEPVRTLNDIILSEIFIAFHKDMNNGVATGYYNSLNSEHPPWTFSQV
ncbi:hypothetical protein ARMSODRAFT_1080615 [Armillaria solidipes]|uniref:LysM domain-containing protein n=1 Tax=Armillaria solidipes TaxID=1076256 RepID=A0A2H3BZB6_9AGAR|nr:hypothetical protein ARMSODRAFT_1080615 [Armillaria solidipes]